MANNKKIAVYETGEYGPFLFKATMNEIIKQRRENIDIISISGRDIANNELLKDDYIGLIMPGRNQGQDYRNELGKKGCAAIQQASLMKGLNTLAVCAGSYVLSSEVNWYNQFQPEAAKIVTNDFALFQGQAIGAFDVWHDGYRSNDPEPNIHTSNVLAVKVLETNFLYSNNQINGHSVYWGGGAFIKSSNSDQKVTSLVKHKFLMQTPNLSKKGMHSFIDTDAVIEFELGQGKHIFSNIHPEINGYRFEKLFNTTPRAKKHLIAFRQDIRNLMNSDILNEYIFHRFIDNCKSKQYDNTEKLQKPEANVALTG